MSVKKELIVRLLAFLSTNGIPATVLLKNSTNMRSIFKKDFDVYDFYEEVEHNFQLTLPAGRLDEVETLGDLVSLVTETTESECTGLSRTLAKKIVKAVLKGVSKYGVSLDLGCIEKEVKKAMINDLVNVVLTTARESK